MADAWDAVAGEYASRIEPFTSSFAAALLDLAGELDGKQVLDVASGSGAVSVLAAIDLGAHVTATDFSERMLDCLNARPSVRFERSAGLVRLDTVLADGQALPAEWSGVFDVAASSFGVIFFDDPAAGVHERTSTRLAYCALTAQPEPTSAGLVGGPLQSRCVSVCAVFVRCASCCAASSRVACCCSPRGAATRRPRPSRSSPPRRRPCYRQRGGRRRDRSVRTGRRQRCARCWRYVSR